MTEPNPFSEQKLPPPSFSHITNNNHSYRSLGNDYFVDVTVEHIPNARLILLNRDLAQELAIDLPKSDAEIEQFILKNFAWFKYKNKQKNKPKNKIFQTFFATRYQDSDDKSEGNALGDGRAIWAGEITQQLDDKHYKYFDIVLKGTGVTPLAWLNHPWESHKDGQVSLTEAVHEFIYSAAAKKNGINATTVLAVIELPFERKVANEKAAIVVRVGNHLRFAHYLYFSDSAAHITPLFEYGLKRDMGLALSKTIHPQDVKNYLQLILNNLAIDAAIYFDIHAVHGSPTFGNITSSGGTIDFATFVYTDAHHNNYSYMPNGVNSLGGEWGQTEQFFNLFSSLISTLKNSQFKYSNDIPSIEQCLYKFNKKFKQTLTLRWLTKLGLAENEINNLSKNTKNRFYEIVKLIYELDGSKKIKFTEQKTLLAAFEPRKILSETANHIDNLNNVPFIWEKLFKVNRNWSTYKLSHAKPYINIYRKVILTIIKDLNSSKQELSAWQQRSQLINLSDRNEPGIDFFYDSERFFASEEILKQIQIGNSWQQISETAKKSISKLADHGL